MSSSWLYTERSVPFWQILGRMANFDSLLFHDDGLMTDYEDASSAALSWYEQKWNLPANIAQIHQDEELMAEWTRRKTQLLIDFTYKLRDTADYYRQYDIKCFLIARNIYAPVVLNPESQVWFAQNIEAFGQAYDYAAVMVMPYMEGAENAEAWLRRLAAEALKVMPAKRLVFELQAVDWRSQSPVPSETLAQWMELIRDAGNMNYGYYPNDFINGHPKTGVLRREFSLETELKTAL
nr:MULTISPECIES: poly-beta-1,6-N-acetyl-D-glucosamine N-deacetylase PgaB [unclassified Halomonas]